MAFRFVVRKRRKLKHSACREKRNFSVLRAEARMNCTCFFKGCVNCMVWTLLSNSKTKCGYNMLSGLLFESAES